MSSSNKKKQNSVIVEISVEDDNQDVSTSFVNGLKELGLTVTEEWDGDEDSPTKYIIGLPKENWRI